MTQEACEPANVPEANISLSQRLNKGERDVYNLADIYAFNEAAKEREQGARRAPPCPECLKRGDRGFIWGIERNVTSKDRIEFMESIEDAEGLTEEQKEELLEQVPTHMIEARCHECGYEGFIGYAWE